MPDNMGMLAGVGQGLSSAVSTYLQTKQMMQENDVKKMLANAQTAEAVGGFLQKAGRKNLSRYGSQFGIQNPDAGATPGPGEPGSLAAQVQSQSPDTGGSMGNPNAAPSQQEIDATADKAMDEPEIARASIMKPLQQRQEYSGPSAITDRTMGLVNSAGKDEPIANATDAAQSWNKIKENYKNPSKAGSVEALMALGRMMNPGSVALHGLDDLKKDTNFYSKYRNQLETVLSGQPLSKNQMEDLMRGAANAGASNYQNYNTQMAKWVDQAKKQGVDPSSLRSPIVESMGKDAIAWQKKLGRYIPPQEQDLASLQGTPQGKKAVDQAKGFFAKLSNQLMPGNSDSAVAQDQAQPPHGWEVKQGNTTFRWDPNKKKYVAK